MVLQIRSKVRLIYCGAHKGLLLVIFFFSFLTALSVWMRACQKQYWPTRPQVWHISLYIRQRSDSWQTISEKNACSGHWRNSLASSWTARLFPFSLTENGLNTLWQKDEKNNKMTKKMKYLFCPGNRISFFPWLHYGVIFNFTMCNQKSFKEVPKLKSISVRFSNSLQWMKRSRFLSCWRSWISYDWINKKPGEFAISTVMGFIRSQPFSNHTTHAR